MQIHWQSQRKEIGSIRSPAADLINKIEAKILADRSYENWITCDQLALAWLIDDAKKQKSNLGRKISKICLVIIH